MRTDTMPSLRSIEAEVETYLRTEPDGRTYEVTVAANGLEIEKAERRVEVRPGKVVFPYQTVGEFYFGDEDLLWEDWARPYLEGEVESPTPAEKRRIVVQEKFDGMVFLVHRDGDKVWLFTESGRERSEIFPLLSDAARKLEADSFVLAVELVEHGEDGKPLPREEMMWTIVGKEPQKEREKRIRLNVHDILFLNGEDVSQKPYAERVKLFEKICSGPFVAARSIFVRTRSELERAIRELSAVEGSEGAMLKYGDFAYPLKAGGPARAPGVAKFKAIVEIDAEVIGMYKVPKARPAGEKWTAEQAAQKLPDLLEESRTWICRVAVRMGDALIPIEATRRLTPADMEFKWDEERQEWKGTDDPARWHMCGKWENRKEGEVAYGNTYPTAMEGIGCGTILTVAPTVVRVFDRETLKEMSVEDFDPENFDPSKHGISWIFPKVRNVKEGGRPGDVRDIIEAFRRLAVAKGAVKAAARAEEAGRDEEEELRISDLTHEEQRRLAETMWGDPYMVHQPPDGAFRFVVQEHIRGIWGVTEREEVKKAVREANALAGKERERALKELFKKHDISVLKSSLAEIREAAQAASDAKENVARVIGKHLSAEVPEELDLGRLVNRANAHLDFRMESPAGNYLIGWTLDTPSAVLQFLEDGRVERLLRNKFLEFREGDNLVCQRKAIQPPQWLEVVTKERPERFGEPGELGGTKETAGGFRFLASGKVVFGVQKSDYHELFLFFDDKEIQKEIGGRWGFSLIRGGAEYENLERAFWLANRHFREPMPYILTHDRDEEERKARREGVHVVWNEGTLSALKKMGYPHLEDKRKEERDTGPPEWYDEGYIWIDIYPERLFVKDSLKVFVMEGLVDAWERIGEFKEPQPDPLVEGKTLLKATQGFGFKSPPWTEEEARKVVEGLGYAEFKVKGGVEALPETVVRFEKATAFLKIEEEKRRVLGVVYEPNVVDSDGEFMTAEEIEKAYYCFLQSGAPIYVMHKERALARITQNYLAPCDLEIEGHKVKRGTWLMEVEILDSHLWQKVKAGELTGFSFGGKGYRRPASEEQVADLVA